MNESNLSMAEIARRNGCNDPITLAEIERAEYIADLLYSAVTWVKRTVSVAFRALSNNLRAAYTRHAH